MMFLATTNSKTVPTYIMYRYLDSLILATSNSKGVPTYYVFGSVGDPDPVGSGYGNFDRSRIRPSKDAYYQSEKVILYINIFSTLAFQQTMKKNFRNFSHNYFKNRHFELFLTSGGFYSLRSDPGSGFFQTGSATTGSWPPQVP
jgi:hypothetical protein